MNIFEKEIIDNFSNVYACIENNTDKINEILFFLNLSNYIMPKKRYVKKTSFKDTSKIHLKGLHCHVLPWENTLTCTYQTYIENKSLLVKLFILLFIFSYLKRIISMKTETIERCT